MITHIGTDLEQGHYVSYVETNCGWHECDDSKVIIFMVTSSVSIMACSYILQVVKTDLNSVLTIGGCYIAIYTEVCNVIVIRHSNCYCLIDKEFSTYI